jgi:hypothetical protein
LTRILKEQQVPMRAVSEGASTNQGRYDVPTIYADTSKFDALGGRR